MPKGMTPRDRRVKKATKPIRKAFKKITEGMTKLKKVPPEAFMTGPRKINSRITKDEIEKYMKKKPREFQTGTPRKTKDKGPMQARPLPMTPEMIKKMKDKKVPNPKATPRDRSKPNIVTPMRRRKSSKQPVGFRQRRATGTRAK